MKENDIRPEALLKKYLQLTQEDAKLYFLGSTLNAIPCIGCGGLKHKHEFDKSDFAYVSCKDCGSLFQAPRPSIDSFSEFYKSSESSRYWAETFFPAVAEIRRDVIFKTRVKKITEICAQKKIIPNKVIDVGAGYGIFLEEWRKLHPASELLAIEPSISLAKKCREKGIAVVEEVVENVIGYENYADLVVCFEVLEHVYDPLLFLNKLLNLVRPGGHILVSTLGVDGFDIQTLWDKSNSIFPPHHINFLSSNGFYSLFKRAGVVEIDITTPGVLDVDIVRNQVNKDPSVLGDQRFLRKILENDAVRSVFQSFLQQNCLSSHVWILGRKPLDHN